jgi:protein archease
MYLLVFDRASRHGGSVLYPGFKIVEHTADVGIEAYGGSIAELFAQAARGMYAVMADLDAVEPRESRSVIAGAANRERLLTVWLLELLFLTETEGMLFSRFEVELGGEDGMALNAMAYGEPTDLGRHELGPEVKAVTRHRLAVTEVEGGYRASVVFDI